MKFYLYCLLAAGSLSTGGVYAQERVVAAKNSDMLFHSSDPKLNANKQIAYHVVKDVLEAGNTEAVDKYVSERYLQHNPNIPSGRDGLKKMLATTKKKQNSPVVAVVAEDDFVVVASVMELPDPKNPGKTYTTTHFDMWRIKDGKADEHWDEALLGPPPPEK